MLLGSVDPSRDRVLSRRCTECGRVLVTELDHKPAGWGRYCLNRQESRLGCQFTSRTYPRCPMQDPARAAVAEGLERGSAAAARRRPTAPERPPAASAARGLLPSLESGRARRAAGATAPVRTVPGKPFWRNSLGGTPLGTALRRRLRVRSPAAGSRRGPTGWRGSAAIGNQAERGGTHQGPKPWLPAWL